MQGVGSREDLLDILVDYVIEGVKRSDVSINNPDGEN